ncbi:MAG TPA: RNase adapter RapZ [Vicinamibacterales bacterium]|nr:RNase adapter RapZ [Vicinamibacterales bacterium]
MKQDQPKLSARPSRADFLVITGLSGAGKSHAIHAVEDLGYYCVDNLPVALLSDLYALHRREEALAKVAVVVDIREREFLSAFPGVYGRLRASADMPPALIFLEASPAALHRRFSETRRPHPLAPDEPIGDAIALERRKMRRIRAMADEIVDTSDLTVHELREIFLGLSHDRKTRATLVLTFESFGFKHGLPLGADLVFDVRFLPNPHFVPTLRPQTGRDKPVAAFLEAQPATGQLLKRLASLLKFLVPQYVSEGKSYLTVGIGCTGGRHRSVYIAEALRRALGGTKGVTARVRHRDAGRERVAP